MRERATREVPNSLSPRWQHIKRCNSVAKGRRYYGRPGLEVFRCPATVSQISGEVLRIFQSTEGSLSAKLHITISRFDVREVGACPRPCVRACVWTLLCHRVHSVLVPLALDKGIGDVRGCSLWLVWVGLTIWIHGTVITTVCSLSLFLTHFLAVRPPPCLVWHSLPIVQSSHFLIPFLSPAFVLTGCAWLSREYLQITTTGERVLPFVSIVAWPDLLDENGIVRSIQIEVREAYRRGDVHFRSDFIPSFAEFTRRTVWLKFYRSIFLFYTG